MPSKSKRSFASDNNAGVHPKIMAAMARANAGHVVAYGDDNYTRSTIDKFRNLLGADAQVFFVFSGTGANVLGLKAVTKAYQAIICADTAHINVDECGAPEKFTGCKLITIKTADGKLRTEDIKPLLHGIGVEHHVQPHVISISQATEMGTVYSADELRTLADFAHRNSLLLHVDGARLANAAVTLKLTLAAITREAGVDVLSFGGAKNGMMYGEAVVFFNRDLAPDFKFVRKQGTHLASKMRFISAQFDALLTNDLWKRNAAHANRMAQILARELSGAGIEISQKVEANAVFAIIPERYISGLQKQYFFYVWNEAISEVRLMTSFDTTEDDIQEFVKLVKKTIAN